MRYNPPMPPLPAEPREKLLYSMLIERYGTDRASREDLRRDLAGWPDCDGIEAELPTALASPAHQVQALVDALCARRLVGAPLLERLVAAGFPHDDLREVALAWGVALDLPARRVGDALPPGTPYRSELYVGWGLAEKRALSQLRHPGSPVVISGPPRVGKTWFIHHLLGEVGARMGARARVCLVNLDDTTEADRADYASFLRWLTGALLGPARADQAPALWEGALNLNARFAEILRREVLEPGPEMLVIAIDRADRLRLRPYNDDLYGMLRARARDHAAPPWDRLRLVLGLSARPEELTGSPHASVFQGLSRPEWLEGFDEVQAEALAGQYALPDAAQVARGLLAKGERRPYNLRGALFERCVAEVADAPW